MLANTLNLTPRYVSDIDDSSYMSVDTLLVAMHGMSRQ